MLKLKSLEHRIKKKKSHKFLKEYRQLVGKVLYIDFDIMIIKKFFFYR